MSNWLLINLARHSDHHAVASRRFQILRAYDEADAPVLPFGYATMYLLALAPPLWFRVMQPRLHAWQATSVDSTLARVDMVRT
jgi:alkane 1-monooxygenase